MIITHLLRKIERREGTLAYASEPCRETVNHPRDGQEGTPND